jgi:hypothetical protein
MHKKPSMAEEKKNDRAEDSINMLLEKSLMQQRDEMMENFSHILQHLRIIVGTSSSSDHFGSTSPFKVQVNFDVFKEQYYHVGNYDDQYMRWTTLWQESGQTVLEFTNNFHTLHTKMGIKDFAWHLVLEYYGAMYRYIQTEMDFLYISSLGVAYRYVVKIKQKFRHQNKWEFGSANLQ